MTNNSDKPVDDDSQPEVNFSFDQSAGDAIGKGLDALKDVFAGFAGMAQQMAGSDEMRNLQAGQWLAQVASSIEEVCTGIRDDNAVPAGKSGEMTCFLERLETEVKGSKAEDQLESLQQRLKKTSQLMNRLNKKNTLPSESELQTLQETLGYFRATAVSINPSGAADDGHNADTTD